MKSQGKRKKKNFSSGPHFQLPPSCLSDFSCFSEICVPAPNATSPLPKTWARDFAGGPVVRNLPSTAQDVGLIPCWETKITHASGQLSPQQNYWVHTPQPKILYAAARVNKWTITMITTGAIPSPSRDQQKPQIWPVHHQVQDLSVMIISALVNMSSNVKKRLQLLGI